MAVEKRSSVDGSPPAALHLATEPLIAVLREAESFDPSFAQECMSAVARCMGLHNTGSNSNSTTTQQQQRSGAVQTRSWQEAQAAAASATTITRTTAAARATATTAGAVQLTAGVLRCVNSFLQAGVVEALLPLLQPQFELARLQVVELLELLLGAVRGDVESRILQFPTGMQVRCYYDVFHRDCSIAFIRSCRIGTLYFKGCVQSAMRVWCSFVGSAVTATVQ
jgi:hypothetical protein